MKAKINIHFIALLILFPSFCFCSSLEILTADGGWNYEIGDTIYFDIHIDTEGESINSVSVYLTFEEEYFAVVLQGVGNDEPFLQGGFLNGAVIENDTHQDPGNGLPGFQLNYSEALLTGSTAGQGITASFQLIAIGETESSTVVFDTELPIRTTMYTVPSGSGYFFDQLITHEISVTDPSSSVQREILPVQSCILSCYPNPFNSGVNVSFSLLKPALCTLIIYDITGRSVFQESFFGGIGEIVRNIDMERLPSGVYYVSLLTNDKFHSVYKICKVN